MIVCTESEYILAFMIGHNTYTGTAVSTFNLNLLYMVYVYTQYTIYGITTHTERDSSMMMEQSTKCAQKKSRF